MNRKVLITGATWTPAALPLRNGLTMHFLRGFSFRLQFHLRKLFDDFGVALPEEQCSPLVCNTASAEWRQFHGSSAVATPTFLSAPP